MISNKCNLRSAVSGTRTPRRLESQGWLHLLSVLSLRPLVSASPPLSPVPAVARLSRAQGPAHPPNLILTQPCWLRRGPGCIRRAGATLPVENTAVAEEIGKPAQPSGSGHTVKEEQAQPSRHKHVARAVATSCRGGEGEGGAWTPHAPWAGKAGGRRSQFHGSQEKEGFPAGRLGEGRA